MGRVKLKIKKLENTNGRQATYAKRKHGIMKKANELSILCDVDLILLMFSPSGKPSICSGTRSSVEEVIAKFAQLTPQERAKRKLESLEALKKTFKKLDHDVNIREFLGTSVQLLGHRNEQGHCCWLYYSSNPTIEDLTNQARMYYSRISELNGRLSFWTEPEQINSIEDLGQMENSIRHSLDQIRAHKENLGKQQIIPLENSCQIQNGLQIPFEQQLQSLTWISNNDTRNNGLESHNLIPHRDMECSGSSSFGSYSGYFGTGKGPDIPNSGQENGLLDELNGDMAMKQQIPNGQQQYSYIPSNLNLMNDMKQHQPLSAAAVNLPMNQTDYHLDRILEAPGTASFDYSQPTWNPSSVPCSESLFDEPLFFQQSTEIHGQHSILHQHD